MLFLYIFYFTSLHICVFPSKIHPKITNRFSFKEIKKPFTRDIQQEILLLDSFNKIFLKNNE